MMGWFVAKNGTNCQCQFVRKATWKKEISLEGIRCFFRFSLGNPGPIPGHIDNHGADRVEQRRTSSSRPAGASVSAVSAGACTKYGDLDNGWWHWVDNF